MPNEPKRIEENTHTVRRNVDRRAVLAGVATAFGAGCVASDLGLVSKTAQATSLDGVGSPEGVMNGTIGDLYTQTDGQHGRTLWRKRTSTGNTGWGLLQSDTGAFNVRDYGAKGDWNGTTGTDDTAAFQACFDDATLGTVLIPNGTYRLTKPIMVPQGTSIVGMGYNSCLNFFGCDGLSFDTSNAIGPVVVSNFHLYGHGCEKFTAIRIPGTRDVSKRTTGLTFDNLYVAFWGVGLFAKNIWHSRMYGLTLNGVYHGIQLVGRSVKNVIDSCSLIRGTSATGNGRARGIYIDSAFDYDGITEARPEDVSVVNTIAFGFDIGIDYSRCLYGNLEKNDLDYCQYAGISIQQSDGGLSVAHNWISIDCSGSGTTGAQYGIVAIDLGSPSGGRIDLRSNCILNQADAPDGSSRGIYLGINQANILVEHNHIAGFGNIDIYVRYCRYVHLEKNVCSSAKVANSIYLVSNIGPVSLDKNVVSAPLCVHPKSNARVTIGETFGVQSTYIRGKSTLEAGATVVTTTFVSLNGAPPDFVGGFPSFLPGTVSVETPTVNLGALWATCTDSDVTIHCTVAPAAQVILRWVIRTQGLLD